MKTDPPCSQGTQSSVSNLTPTYVIFKLLSCNRPGIVCVKRDAPQSDIPIECRGIRTQHRGCQGRGRRHQGYSDSKWRCHIVIWPPDTLSGTRISWRGARHTTGPLFEASGGRQMTVFWAGSACYRMSDMLSVRVRLLVIEAHTQGVYRLYFAISFVIYVEDNICFSHS